MNLKEFASRLELSQTTASRALSGYPEVKQATGSCCATGGRPSR